MKAEAWSMPGTRRVVPASDGERVGAQNGTPEMPA